MQKIGLFYASSTGNTKGAAKMIKEQLGDAEITMYDIASCSQEDMNQYDYLIIGTSTWGEGDLQDDLEEFFPKLEAIDFSTKTVALFGFGDQEQYCDYYLDAMGILYEAVVKQGAKVVGSWPTDGYGYEESKAVVDGEFVGLALDADNQDDMTNERISMWAQQIAPYFKVA
ncbi:flavodoxin [Sulfurimonas sp.]|uniref:flavodoxin n=1 Tax=Sulfurimonas sp. TaxID=2022749 RepID=UPI003D0E7669